MASIVLTGANRGIGHYMARQLLEDGHQVAMLDIATDQIAELAAQYTKTLLPFVCDVTNAAAVTEAVSSAAREFGGIDYAIHNACVCTFEGFLQSGLDTFRRVHEVNFYGALHLTKAVLPTMLSQKRGRVFFVSSGVGVMGFTNISPYASSKGALESLAKCLYLEYRTQGVTFHLMHPPLTKTASSSPLPIPAEMKEDPEKVGRGLARRLHKNKFIICHSAAQTLQTKMAYRFPLALGGLMSKMTANFEQPGVKNDA